MENYVMQIRFTYTYNIAEVPSTGGQGEAPSQTLQLPPQFSVNSFVILSWLAVLAVFSCFELNTL